MCPGKLNHYTFPENTAILWWYALEDLIIKNNEIILSENRQFICQTKQQKEQVFLEIREIIIGLSNVNFLVELNNLFANYKVDWRLKTQELALNWEQIIKLSSDPLCTIAGHTKNHYALNVLDEDEVISEIIDANNLIKEKVGQDITHFCYPFGGKNEVNKREFEIAKKTGVKTATTTRRGNIYQQHKQHLECLPRVMLTENFNIKSTFKIRIKRVVSV